MIRGPIIVIKRGVQKNIDVGYKILTHQTNRIEVQFIYFDNIDNRNFSLQV